ncbi:unnamed protein product [Onchocerca flexuosa]|uniref:Cystatin domain-containing protein n=1 Tax=Onchocerca flexuosa TaxID=387005 RepID=A0A183GZ95_9BILA|nr:unnamed protein product [Onchocerca flexuosa]
MIYQKVSPIISKIEQKEVQRRSDSLFLAAKFSEQILLSASAYFVVAVCWRSFDFHFEQEILMIVGVSYEQKIIYRVAFREFSAQHLICEILNVFPLRPQNCHRQDYIHQPITYQFFKCECKHSFFDDQKKQKKIVRNPISWKL